MSELGKVCRASGFALFPAQHHGWPNPLCRLCSHRVVQMVWLWSPFLSCKVGKWWGKFVSAWNDSSPQIPGPQLLHNPQKIPTCALRHCFPSFFLFFVIISSPHLASGALEGCRGADVAPHYLSNVASWRVTGRTRQDGSARLQSQHSRRIRDWGILGKGPIYRFVKDITWLRSIGDQSPPIPHWQPDPQLVNNTRNACVSKHSWNCQEDFQPASSVG